jgi:hypothetical protein
MPDASVSQAFVAAVRSAAMSGPILVVATSDIVGRLAPDWAVACQRQGLHYRVLVVDPDCPLAAEDIANEAVSLSAGGILAAGAADLVNTATVAAKQRGLPLAMLAVG